MRPVTGCIMAYNEEDRIGDALDSLAFCSERVVVDSHSSDRTREIARGHGARVIERDWPGHIEQMNFVIDQARSDWVLCVDADERVTAEMRRSVIEALSSDDSADGFWVNRRNIYLGRWVRHGGWYPDRKIRLFRRSRGRYGGVNPHAVVCMAPEARTSSLHGDLEHLPYRSLEEQIETLNYYTTITAGEMVLQAKSGFRLRQLLAPPGRFVKMFVLQRGFLDGWRGFLLPQLLRRYGPFVASLLLAVVWALWHLPIDIRSGFLVTGPGAVLIRIIWTIPVTIIFTWFYIRSGGNLLVALFLHTSINILSDLGFSQYERTALFLFVLLAIAAILISAASTTFRIAGKYQSKDD